MRGSHCVFLWELSSMYAFVSNWFSFSILPGHRSFKLALCNCKLSIDICQCNVHTDPLNLSPLSEKSIRRIYYHKIVGRGWSGDSFNILFSFFHISFHIICPSIFFSALKIQSLSREMNPVCSPQSRAVRAITTHPWATIISKLILYLNSSAKRAICVVGGKNNRLTENTKIPNHNVITLMPAVDLLAQWYS